MAMHGRTAAFGELVNERAKAHPGQARIARLIRETLAEENYVTPTNACDSLHIQDRYSLRCTPQILGPVWDTLVLTRNWLTLEMNGASDNPLVAYDGDFANGGNFYGGYLSQGMDYLKISLGHVADLLDRQLAMLVDEKSNRGLPPNLAAWNRIPDGEQFLHHGLKGLHQAASAITSEILARAIPNSIFSRSAESHNQDKVSLGMSAAVSCAELIEPLFNVQALYLICLAQALDLREIRLRGETSQKYFSLVRKCVPFVEGDRALDEGIGQLVQELKLMSREEGVIFSDEKA
jgi:histidine ammonia-lyase/phenylalanine ammonia-lyase